MKEELLLKVPGSDPEPSGIPCHGPASAPFLIYMPVVSQSWDWHCARGGGTTEMKDWVLALEEFLQWGNSRRESLRVATGEVCTREQKRVRKASASSHLNSPGKATLPGALHFSDSEATCFSEQADKDMACPNSGRRYWAVVGPTAIQTLGKDGCSGPSCRGAVGDFCTFLKPAFAERTVPSLPQGAGRRTPVHSVNTTGSKAPDWPSDLGQSVAFPLLQLPLATHRLAYR